MSPPGTGRFAGFLGLKNGTIQKVDPTTGTHETWASGLIMPNGLAFLPDGSAVTTRDLNGVGRGFHVTRVPAKDRAHPQYNWSSLAATNGIATDPTGRWVYVDQFRRRSGARLAAGGRQPSQPDFDR